MSEEERLFSAIVNRLCMTSSEIKPRKMMRSPAVAYNGKVFAFLSKEKYLVCKFGAIDTDIYPFKIEKFNPFQDKRKFSGWYQIPFSDNDYWIILAKMALKIMKNKK